MEEYIISAKAHEITPLFVGREACDPGHSFGPYIRDCYIVHFCLGGEGVLENRHGTYKIGAGQLFVIRPGEVTTYTADKTNPWEYAWVAFRTDEVYFDGERSVFDTPQGLDDKLVGILGSEQLSYEGCLAVICDLVYHTANRDDGSAGDEKIRRVRRYVKYNYMLPISVGQLSRSFGFERSYLYRMFKDRYGIGIKEYITSVRMERAAEFLRSGYSVKESAHMVGYEDEFGFSKAFKARYGVSPSRIKNEKGRD